MSTINGPSDWGSEGISRREQTTKRNTETPPAPVELLRTSEELNQSFLVSLENITRMTALSPVQKKFLAQDVWSSVMSWQKVAFESFDQKTDVLRVPSDMTPRIQKYLEAVGYDKAQLLEGLVVRYLLQASKLNNQPRLTETTDVSSMFNRFVASSSDRTLVLKERNYLGVLYNKLVQTKVPAEAVIAKINAALASGQFQDPERKGVQSILWRFVQTLGQQVAQQASTGQPISKPDVLKHLQKATVELALSRGAELDNESLVESKSEAQMKAYSGQLVATMRQVFRNLAGDNSTNQPPPSASNGVVNFPRTTNSENLAA
jgi:hypothetical protein